MNTFKIFKLNHMVETALELAISEEGEIVNESALVLWENSLEAKNEYLLDMACEVKNLEAEEEALDKTIKDLRTRKQYVSNKIDRVKSFLSASVGKGEKLSDGRVKISWRKSSPVIIDSSAPDPKEADPKFTKTKIEFSLTQIKEAIEAGEEISWASIKEVQNIQIK